MARGIFKRSNSRNYWIRYAGLDGRIVRESAETDKFRAAEALLIKRKQEIKEGKQPEIKKIANHSFRELVDKYKAWTEGRQRSAQTKKYILDQLCNVYGNYPLRRFNTSLVEQLQTDIISKGLKPASNNKTLNILKHAFRKAVEWDMVEEDVLKRIHKVKPLKDVGKRLRYLSKEECQNLINACDPHLKPIVITALNTGMRRGEILGLKWDNVDLKHGFILLDKTKNGDRREIPINETLRMTFQSVMRRLDIPYIFYDPRTGDPYKEVKHSFSSACKRAGITDFRFHDLRHTFASQLIMSGIDLTTVKELMGHRDVKMTLRYAHLAPAHKIKAVTILDNALNGKISSVGERLLEPYSQQSGEVTQKLTQLGVN
jgi:integrase